MGSSSSKEQALLDQPFLSSFLSLAPIKNILQDEVGIGTADSAILHNSAAEGEVKLVTLLLQIGSNVNSYAVDPKTSTRATPLHFAIAGGQTESVKVLLSHGADVTLSGHFKTGGSFDDALDLMKTYPNKQIMDMIVKEKNRLANQNLPTSWNESMEIDRIGKLIGKRHKMEESITLAESIQKKIGKENEELKKINETVLSLRADPAYRTSSEVERMRAQVFRIKNLEKVVIENRDQSKKDDAEHDDRDCPICFCTPEQVYTCIKCDNWSCWKCLQKLTLCPVCGINLTTNPPQRNKALERILRKRH